MSLRGLYIDRDLLNKIPLASRILYTFDIVSIIAKTGLPPKREREVFFVQNLNAGWTGRKIGDGALNDEIPYEAATQEVLENVIRDSPLELKEMISDEIKYVPHMGVNNHLYKAAYWGTYSPAQTDASSRRTWENFSVPCIIYIECYLSDVGWTQT